MSRSDITICWAKSGCGHISVKEAVAFGSYGPI